MSSHMFPVLTFFEALMLGHILGDYFFQNTWMAVNKSKSTPICLVHCIIYTLTICAMTSWNGLWAWVVFLSHFIPDRFGLPEWWLKATRSRSLERFMKMSHKDVPIAVDDDDVKENYMILSGGFTTFVYVIVDNGLHIMLMLLGARYLWMHGLMR